MTSAELQEHIRLSYKSRKIKSTLVCLLLVAATVVAIAPLFSVLNQVVINGLASLNFSFFTQLPRPVGEAGGGMANAIVGTIILVILASVLGIPLGMVTGIYLSEFGQGRFGDWVRFGADMLSSIPSIVIGLFAYALIVLPTKHFSAIAGGVALGVIMVPTVARSTEELLRLVPVHIREAGLALGLPRWKVIVRIVLRGSLGAIITGVMLAVARVAGETAPLLFTALGNQFWARSINEPIASLPVQIYSYAISPFEEWHRQAWTAALVLVLLVLATNIITRVLLQTRVTGSRE